MDWLRQQLNVDAFWETIDRMGQMEWHSYGIGLFIVLFFLLLRKLFTRYVFSFVMRLAQKTRVNIDVQLLEAFKRPLRVFFVVFGVYLAIQYVSEDPERMEWITSIYRSIIVMLIAWGMFSFSSVTSGIFQQISQRLGIELDTIVLPFISKTVRFIIVILAFMVIAEEWEYNISGFIAGLGLGGLAFSLAARDSIANLFGGLVIITEKPFTIGDWVETPSVEGTVEDITFRSTKIRTFADAVVTMPNSTLADEPITNWTRMGKRRITFRIGVTYSTPREKLERCVRRINDLLHAHEDVHKELIFVRFDEFSESSLDIFLYFFTITTNWDEWLQVKENINFLIMQILEEEGVSIAIPSRSIYMANDHRIRHFDSSSAPSRSDSTDV